MQEIIEGLKNLPDEDKQKLLQGISEGYYGVEKYLHTLSIFNQNVIRDSFGNYDFEYHTGGNIYYLGCRNSDIGFFIDNDKKILFYSRYYFVHLAEFLKQIDQTLAKLDHFDMNAAIDIGENYAAVGKWFISYGHFKDEAYILGDFIRSYSEAKNCTAILDYPIDSALDTNSFTFNENYGYIDKLIFNGKSTNTYLYGNATLKLRNLYIINNHILARGFHSFPINISKHIRDQIASKISETSGGGGSERVFLTRSDSPRDFKNKSEIENFLSRSNVAVINPELISYEHLVYALRDVRTIFITYGSALTNLVYLPIGTRVVILKSQSYMHESIELWNKVIDTYRLFIIEIPAEADIIAPHRLAPYL